MKQFNRQSVQFAPRVTMVTDLLKNHRGRMFCATFIKTDGSVRKLNGRFGVHKGINGAGMNHDPAEKGHHVVSEVIQARGHDGRILTSKIQYRTINFNTLQKVKFNGKALVALESVGYSSNDKNANKKVLVAQENSIY